jgi:hypothetical protein
VKYERHELDTHLLALRPKIPAARRRQALRHLPPVQTMTPIRYTTPSGDQVTACAFATSADLPVYDIEVVRHGEVVEYIPRVIGHTGLTMLAATRHWKET